MINDKAHNYLKCKDCDRQLADVVILRDADVSFNYVGLCPFCGGESETKSIRGIVATGSVQGTVLADRKTTNDKVILHMKKEKI